MKSSALLLLIIIVNPLHAYNWLEGDFHINKDFTYFYSERSEFPHPPPSDWYLSEGQTNLYQTLLDDVHFLYSFMIYGAQFIYIPGDSTDGVEDRFELTLINEIPWGDPNLSITDLWFEGRELYIHTRYKLNESQGARLKSLESSLYPVAGGWGEASSLEENSRQESVKMAIRKSIRNYWQPREYNRPREISGKVFLRRFPLFGITQGNHRASVMVRFHFDDPLTYPN